ncbi:GNAT family N-acetyltransferase [Novosphingobium sp. 1949]|uniref:GNAT family N-acetyltransferase n=1 Tax=Novosphingobium organovorum TaxID=2930092 RepID=A0ABT0B940_9SPHN|nr:GNAT family N-acetyltransferase [Novosphingobium organovorum]MCJ2181562.1 GNAT family N-acetyltransferase [Novosphingobium organovorum]
MTIVRDDPAAPHLAALLALHVGEVQAALGEFAYALDASGLSSPEVTFWSAWDGEELAGFAGLKRIDARACEVKSMRAAPSMRGKGVGRALMDHLIAAAREGGYETLFLETAVTPMHVPAVALYRSAGFVECPVFGDYRPGPHSLFMQLAL